MPRAVVNPEDQIYYVCTMYYYLVLCSSKKESKVIHRAFSLDTHNQIHPWDRPCSQQQQHPVW